MATLVSQRLDYLMRVTGTTNSTLGRVVRFDPSYISRIRSGKRGIPKHQPFIRPAAEFFARNLTQPAQQKLLGDMILHGKPWPREQALAADHIAEWLEKGGQSEEAQMGQLLSGLSRIRPAAPGAFDPSSREDDIGSPNGMFYGREGKRQAVLIFLRYLLTLDAPQRLLLYSDEDMEWLTEDPTFTRTWAELLGAILSRGSRIVMIHTVSRDLGEMLDAIAHWMPLYLTGAIEPWYCPRVRDGIWRRTLFIAEGQLAVTASSVTGGDTMGLNLLINDSQAVAALEREFSGFFSLCRPLMKIIPDSRRNEAVAAFRHLATGGGSAILAHGLSLPLPGGDTESHPILRADSRERVQRLRTGGPLTEILHLPPAEELRSLSPEVAGELAEALEQILELMDRSEDYQVVLSREIPRNIALLAREDRGFLLIQTDPPAVSFRVEESRLAESMWVYLQGIIGFDRSEEVSRRRLRQYVDSLRETEHTEL